MINIPNLDSKVWKQGNDSDLTGNIHITKNITFDDQGYLKLSLSPRAVMNETIDADFDNPAAVHYNSDYGYFIATWDKPFQARDEILSSYPTQVATAGVPATDIQSDIASFGGLMVVSQDTDVDYYDESTNAWTDTNISLTASGQHKLVHFVSLNALAVVNVNTVNLYSSPITATPTLATTLTIPSDFAITSAVYHNQELYVATQHLYGGHAHLFIWGGTGTGANKVYELDSNIIFSVERHLGAVYMTTGNGSIMVSNGGQPEFVAGFPIFYTDQSISGYGNIGNYKNTLKSNGDLLYILFNNESNETNRLLDQPDGVWCLDGTNLYHRYSLSNSLVLVDSIPTTDVNTTNNQITVTTAPTTGTEVVYYAGGGAAIPELTHSSKYYTIKIDATHVSLATTLSNANAGTAIDLTGTGSIFQKLIFYPNVDYGTFFDQRTFALSVIERPVENRILGTEILWGAEVVRRDSTDDYGFLGTVADGVEARGYFVTPKITSSELTDTFNTISLKFSPFTSETDKIIIKYRTVDDMKKYINTPQWSITWTSSTTFTTTNAGWADAVVGDEVNVLQGAAGGLLAHITSITSNAGTYTVTIDETFKEYTSGDISAAVFRNWKKFATIEYQDIFDQQGFFSKQLGAKSKHLELKIELRGVSVRIEELKVDNVYSLPARKSA